MIKISQRGRQSGNGSIDELLEVQILNMVLKK
jgi:hypothetical protein